MSRLKKFTVSLWSGQITLVANVVYTAVSIPLALHYLGKTEFGVWAVALQFSGYLALLDGGMGGAFSRLLIDHKDTRENGRYGAMFKLSLLVSALQGMIILLVGAALSLSAASLFKLPLGLERDFHWLFIGQCVLTMGMFCLRPWGYVLFAHQRMDVGNHIATLQLLVSLALLFLFFERSCGIYSILYANVLSWLLFAWVPLWVCYRNGYMPRRHEFGKINRELMREAVGYGMDLFFIVIGTQLMMSSQTLLIGHLMGMEAVAVWSVMTRAFNLVCQVVWKIMNFAQSALAEMFVRGEMEKLRQNVRDVTVLTGCLAAVGAAGLMVCNNDFNIIWTRGQIVWAWDNNVLLGLWFFLISIYRCYNSLPALSKQLGLMKYVYIGEGAVYVVAVLLCPLTMRFEVVLGLSLMVSALFSGLYGIMRGAEILQVRKRELLGWNTVALMTLAVVGVSGSGVWLALRYAPPLVRFTVSTMFIASVGGVMIFRYGISKKHIAHLPLPIRRFFNFFDQAQFFQ